MEKLGDFSVHRTLVLSVMDEESVPKIRGCLEELPGMEQLVFDDGRRRLELTYDASLLGLPVIEQALADAGCSAADGRWSRMRRAWYRYLDENARANAMAKGACCSNPEEVYAKRHK